MLYIAYYNPSGSTYNVVGDNCWDDVADAKTVAYDKFIDSQLNPNLNNLDARIKKDELWYSLPCSWVKSLTEEMYSLNTGALGSTVTKYGVCGRGTAAWTAVLPQLRLVYAPH